MSYQNHRERFLVSMALAGMWMGTARRILRLARTLQRLSEAQCNGDYPYDNGTRKTVPCPICESGTVRSSILGSKSLPKGMKACPDCRTTARVKEILPAGFSAVFNGDPRGFVLRIVVPGGQYSDSGRCDNGVFGVPTY